MFNRWMTSIHRLHCHSLLAYYIPVRSTMMKEYQKGTAMDKIAWWQKHYYSCVQADFHKSFCCIDVSDITMLQLTNTWMSFPSVSIAFMLNQHFISISKRSHMCVMKGNSVFLKCVRNFFAVTVNFTYDNNHASRVNKKQSLALFVSKTPRLFIIIFIIISYRNYIKRRMFHYTPWVKVD